MCAKPTLLAIYKDTSMRHLHLITLLMLIALAACGARDTPVAQQPTRAAASTAGALPTADTVVTAEVVATTGAQPLPTVPPAPTLPTPADPRIPADSDTLPLLRDVLQAQGMGDELMASQSGTPKLILSEVAPVAVGTLPVTNTFTQGHRI